MIDSNDTTGGQRIAIVMAARNEASTIEGTLAGLARQQGADRLLVVICVNGSTDGTAARARESSQRHEALQVEVIELEAGSKPRALNAAEAHARSICPAPAAHVYMDADVIIEPALIAALVAGVRVSAPRIAAPKKALSPTHSWLVNFCAKAWLRLPWVQDDIVGGGIFAVNASGRGRWQESPDLMSDDCYIAYQFAPSERVIVDSAVAVGWPNDIRSMLRAQRRWINGGLQLANSPQRPPFGPAWTGKRRLRAMLHPSVLVAAVIVRCTRVSARIFFAGGQEASWTTSR